MSLNVFFSTSFLFGGLVIQRCKNNFCYRNANSANGSANDFRNLVEIVYDLLKPTAHADCLAFGMCMCDDDGDDEKKKEKLLQVFFSDIKL